MKYMNEYMNCISMEMFSYFDTGKMVQNIVPEISAEMGNIM